MVDLRITQPNEVILKTCRGRSMTMLLLHLFTVSISQPQSSVLQPLCTIINQPKQLKVG